MQRVFLALALSFTAIASAAPNCYDRRDVLNINNDEVIQWKATTANSFKARAHIEGKLVKVYPGKHGHYHFSVRIGTGTRDTIEVVYNESFGRLPRLKVGQTVEACGDYITSNRPTGQYPASPDGAIIHWVHKNPHRGHEDGYVQIDGVLAGNGRN